ncbi:HicB family protein [Clostridia bacterium]|nr:HicB family protein [Clostridia bacterium]
MKYAYPAIFTPLDGGEYDVYVPDLHYVRTCGHNLAEAIEMAEDAISMWLWDAENKKEDIPSPSETLTCEALQFVNFVKADTDEYRRKFDSRSVKKTLTIPAWLNYQAEQVNAPFSQILQGGLRQFLGISE